MGPVVVVPVGADRAVAASAAGTGEAVSAVDRAAAVAPADVRTKLVSHRAVTHGQEGRLLDTVQHSAHSDASSDSFQIGANRLCFRRHK